MTCSLALAVWWFLAKQDAILGVRPVPSAAVFEMTTTKAPTKGTHDGFWRTTTPGSPQAAPAIRTAKQQGETGSQGDRRRAAGAQL